MSHQVIIIESSTPPPPAATAVTDFVPEFHIEITYRPNDALTPAQIGNEIARIQRRVNQIIEGTPD